MLAPVALAVVWQGGVIFELWMVLAGALMAREWGRLTAAGRPAWPGCCSPPGSSPRRLRPRRESGPVWAAISRPGRSVSV
ncbi:MAG: hypothetical protein WDO24_26375 [Pseudomonadota bacterium]